MKFRNKSSSYKVNVPGPGNYNITYVDLNNCSYTVGRDKRFDLDKKDKDNKNINPGPGT